MPAARYWQVNGLMSYDGGAVSVTELQLFVSGSRVDASATVSSVIAPATGALADLYDGSTSSGVSWSAKQAAAPGFGIVWDFGGAPRNIDEVRIGAGAAKGEYPYKLRLQYSSDAVSWRTLEALDSIDYPGANTLQPVVLVGASRYTSRDVLLLHMDGSPGSTTFTDSAPTPKTVTAFGNAQIASSAGALGGSCGAFDGAGDYLTVPHSTDFDFGVGDFTLSTFLATAASDGFLASRDSNNNVDYGNLMLGIAAGKPYFLCNPTSSSAVGRVTLTGSTSVNDGQRHHVEVSRFGSNWVLFVDGYPEAMAVSDVGFRAATAPLYIGCLLSSGVPSFFFNGTLDEFVMIKGAAQHVEGFTPARVARGAATTGLSSRLLVQRLSYSPPVVISAATADVSVVTNIAPLGLDMEDGGSGSVAGTTKEKATPANIPLSRKVRLFHEASGRLIRERWSDASGNYTFPDLKKNTRYTVVAHDHTEAYRAVVADRVEAT